MKATYEKHPRLYLAILGGLVIGCGLFAIADYIVNDTLMIADDDPALENDNPNEARPVSVIRSFHHAHDLKSPSQPKTTSFFRTFPNPSQEFVKGFSLLFALANPSHAPPRTVSFS